MSPRVKFTRLNSRYDLKHIRDDFHLIGLPDPNVYDFARRRGRLILPFNGDDFKPLVTKSQETGVIYLSDHLLNEKIDTKLTALLSKSTPKTFYCKFTTITVKPHLPMPPKQYGEMRAIIRNNTD